MPQPTELQRVHAHLTEASALLGRMVAAGDTRYGVNDAYTLALDALAQVTHEQRVALAASGWR